MNAIKTYEFLERRLQQTIDFVKYSEAKNAALAGISLAALAAIINLEIQKNYMMADSYFLAATKALFLISLLVSLYTFLPQYRKALNTLEKNVGDPEKAPNDEVPNIAYFGEFTKFSNLGYVSEVVTRFDENPGEKEQKVLLDLADQCIQNGNIVKTKLSLFRLGCAIFLVALITFASANIFLHFCS